MNDRIIFDERSFKMEKVLLNFDDQEFFALDPSIIESIEVKKEVVNKTTKLDDTYVFKKGLFFTKKIKVEGKSFSVFDYNRYAVTIYINNESELCKNKTKAFEVYTEMKIRTQDCYFNPYHNFTALYFVFKESFLPKFIEQLNEHNIIKKYILKES